MVRCYSVGTKVAGFGYQEINAFYQNKIDGSYISSSKRYYYSENCGLFQDLKKIMEAKWIPELQNRLEIKNNQMPVIWDADFFINSMTATPESGKYSLCEINVSSVSPFPPSAIKYMVDEVVNRLS